MKPECAACEERLPDLAEDALGVVVRGEVERHLASCADCRELYATLTATTRTFASLRPEPTPPAALAGRIAHRTWRRPLTLAALWPMSPERGGPPWRVQAVAAAMSVVVSTLIYVVALGVNDPGSLPARTYRSVNRGAAELRGQGETWMEDLRLVRVLVSTALGGRLDRVQEQVEDYRRLMDKRRKEAPPAGPVPNHRTPEGRPS